jgi:hypothetical protein
VLNISEIKKSYFLWYTVRIGKNMEKQIDENLIYEATKPTEKSREGFEMSPEQANQITAELSKLNDAILHDKPISIDDLEDLSKVARGTKIDVGGEIMTVEEAEKIPDLKRNMKIWDEMKEGNFENTGKLTFLTPKVARIFSEKCNRTELWLESLSVFSPEVAKELAKFKGKHICLCGVRFVSDLVAMYLGKSNIEYVNLHELESLSEVAAKNLAEHPNIVKNIGNPVIRAKIAKYKEKV